MKHGKIAIIGAGMVGSATAYALLLRDIPADIILIDRNDAKCEGEVFDLVDALSLSLSHSISKGSLSDAASADIIIITAGIAQTCGQSRLDLLDTNALIVRDIFVHMQPNPKAIIIVVTNPVDSMTQLVAQLSGLPKNQVFGSGTFLDTQRLRMIISKQIKIAPELIELYVIGEHGDSQVVAWSTATIAGMPLLQFPGLQKDQLLAMAQETKEKACSIIACKGSTSFGVAACIAYYCKIILSDFKHIIPVSCFNESYGVCVSMPVILGASGVERIVALSLDCEECADLENSVQLLKKYYAGIE